MNRRVCCSAFVLLGCSFLALPLLGEESAVPRQLKTFKLQNITAQDSLAAVQTLLAARAARPAAAAAAPQAAAALAIDAKAKTLFVRGAAEQIDEIQKLLVAIDQPAEKLADAKLESADLLAVKFVPARAVQSVLQQLQINCTVLQMGNAGMIMVATDPATKDQLAQVKEVLKTLDVKEEPKVAAQPAGAAAATAAPGATAPAAAAVAKPNTEE